MVPGSAISVQSHALEFMRRARKFLVSPLVSEFGQFDLIQQPKEGDYGQICKKINSRFFENLQFWPWSPCVNSGRVHALLTQSVIL